MDASEEPLVEEDRALCFSLAML